MPLTRRRLVLALAALPLLAVAAAPAADKPKRLLLVTHSGGFMHDSIGVAEEVLREVGPSRGYEVTAWRFTNDPAAKVKYRPAKDAPEVEANALERYSEQFRGRTGMTVGPENCGRVNKDTLKNFDVVLFFTTGRPVNNDELKDLMEWVNAGGAFAGTHCATDTLYDTPYGDLIGGYFRTHPPGLQTVKLKVEDPKHPATAAFTDGEPYKDEIYIFRDAPYSRDKLRILLSVAPDSNFDPQKGKRDDGDYAISWCKEYGKGKVFYTSLGHPKDTWKDARFQNHLFGGLDWAVGRLPGDATPTGVKK